MAKKSMKSTKKGGCWSGGCSGGKRRTRRVRGGAYGAGDAIAVGALEYKGVDTASPVNPVTGVMTPDIYDVKSGGRRRSRKSRKGKGKGRKSRKMRGGASQISAMKAGYGFNGSGSAGLADAVPAPTSGGNAY